MTLKRLVKEVHTVVAGRARYNVQGLYRSSMLKNRLETRLSAEREITYVSANILTGNLLILFHPHSNPRKFVAVMESVVVAHLRHVSAPRSSGLSVSADKRKRSEVEAAHRSWVKGGLAEKLGFGTGAVAEEAHAWHRMDITEVLSVLNSSLSTGLTPEAAKRNRQIYGLNVISQPSTRSRFGIFIDQFKSLPVGLLGIAAVLSILTGGLADAILITGVVLINAVIGFVTEHEAEKTISSLRRMINPPVQVIREGNAQEIGFEDVLVGDLLLLKPGTYVSADARVVEALHLSADESVLTGESMPVVKTADRLRNVEVPLADRCNMVYSGTLITGGQGLAVVAAVGPSSQFGRIRSLVATAEAPETPVEKQLGIIGNQLVWISSAICGIVFAIGLLRGNGLLQMLKISISLAVAAVPEGLPAVATTTLALGVRHMRRHKVLVRNLDAVCTIGSAHTICLDKTGTITHNKMSVLRIYSGMRRINVNNGDFTVQSDTLDLFGSDELLRLIHVCVLCNEAQISRNSSAYVLNGSSTEAALVEMALVAGVNVEAIRARYPLLNVDYRSDDHQYMRTLHRTQNRETILAIKGNPVEVLAGCSGQVREGVHCALTESDRDAIEAENDSMAGDALRVLGVAYATRETDEPSDEGNGWTWLGLVGMADPIRDGVKESIDVFHGAGLDTVMLTGDQSPTAYAVGKELNLSNGKPLQILEATELKSMDPSVTQALCNEVHVFARVSPSNKLEVVRALQGSGKVVAMTGDGINDGPALKAADIGIAMGRGGTDMAREVADVVLEEDDLETLIVAISDGRTIYNNIRKTLHYLLSTNLSEIMVMFFSGALGLGYPLNAAQLLWINLLSDIFPGLALAMDPPEPDVLTHTPRDPNEPIVKTEDFKRMSFEAATMTAASLGAYGYGIARYGFGPAAGTLAFQGLAVSQIVHALSCRSEERSLFDADKPLPNRYVTVAVVGSLALQVIAQMVPGLRALLGTRPLGVLDWAVVGASGIIPLFINEVTKKKSLRTIQ
ncbi:MAG TPA: cation-transporting P-type ATPase [Desulfomonilaceae bacterium]|nr:cation-transporting P-type ATPase [Desulfomonilaceae bacterium]